MTNDISEGGSTEYYAIPEGAKDLQDLIEFKNMNFSQGNLLKSIYRLGNCPHSSAMRDLNKIIWFTEREINRLKKNTNYQERP